MERMNWQAYTNRMNAWQALNPGASSEQREAASFAIEKDVAKSQRKARVAPEKRDLHAPALRPIDAVTP